MQWQLTRAPRFIAMVALVLSARIGLANTADFEGLVSTGDHYDGAPSVFNVGDSYAGSFASGGIDFNYAGNKTEFGGQEYTYWDGWAASKVNDVTTGDYTNQYAAYSLSNGGAGHNSDTYGVAYDGYLGIAATSISAPVGHAFASMRITNTTYAALVIRDGNSETTAFSADDYFKLTITGYEGGINGTEVGAVDLFLADYRNGKSEIVSEWTMVDLASLTNADTLTFSFESTDNDPVFGINTPTYFAADDIVTVPVPEPSAGMLLGLGVLMTTFARRRRR